MTHEERLVMLSLIIEAFEDFLTKRGIDIPNPEKEQSPDSASLIYGTDYMELESAVEDILISYGMLDKEEFGNGNSEKTETNVEIAPAGTKDQSDH